MLVSSVIHSVRSFIVLIALLDVFEQNIYTRGQQLNCDIITDFFVMNLNKEQFWIKQRTFERSFR